MEVDSVPPPESTVPQSTPVPSAALRELVAFITDIPESALWCSNRTPFSVFSVTLFLSSCWNTVSLCDGLRRGGCWAPGDVAERERRVRAWARGSGDRV